MSKKILTWACVLAICFQFSTIGIRASAVPETNTTIQLLDPDSSEETQDDQDNLDETSDLPDDTGDEPVFEEEDSYVQEASSLGSTQTRNTIAAWGFSGAESSDVFYATDGELKNAASIYAHIDRTMTTSNVSISGYTYPGTLYCGNWGVTSDGYKSWVIRFSTIGYENITLTFASYGVKGAPRDFRVETQDGIVLTTFESGSANTSGNYTRVTVSLPSYFNDQKNATIFIVQEGNVSVSGGIVQSGTASNSRIGDIFLSGDGAIAPDPTLEAAISAWRFASVDQFDASLSAPATDGVFLDATLHIVGAGGGLAIGTGSTAGQLYCTGWNDASDVNEKSWTITTTSGGYSALKVSFGARSSPKGPTNFALEVDYGSGWESVAQYTLTETLQNFSFALPYEANDKDVLRIRSRVTDTVSVDGTVVQSAGTSRMYRVTVVGTPIPTEGTGTATIELYLMKGQECIVPVYADNVASFEGETFTLTYNPDELQLLDFAAQTGNGSTAPGLVINTPLTIVSHSSGEIVFQFAKSIPADYAWSGVMSLLKFKALNTMRTTLTIGMA